VRLKQKTPDVCIGVLHNAHECALGSLIIADIAYETKTNPNKRNQIDSRLE
jgi:hypothetical protein